MSIQHTIPVICISGGPCAGKTTVLPFLKQKLGEYGYTVIIINEGATEFKLSGLTPNLFTGTQFQSHLLEHIIETENRKKRAVIDMACEKKVIICDRGTMDAAAYVNPKEFNEIITSLGYTTAHLREQRYDAVIFLRSVAHDMPDVYTCANNAAREETVEEAKERDELTLKAWMGHPHLKVIGNTGGIDMKFNQTLTAVRNILGVPEPLEIERTFLVPSLNVSSLPKEATCVEIIQRYLLSHNGIEERIRTWKTTEGTTYYHTQKKTIAAGIRVEWEQKISQQEYTTLLRQRDHSLGIIRKTRYCFVWKNQYFELDVFKNPKGLVLLEAELLNESDTVPIPSFIKGAQDVTDIAQYSNYEIAKGIA